MDNVDNFVYKSVLRDFDGGNLFSENPFFPLIYTLLCKFTKRTHFMLKKLLFCPFPGIPSGAEKGTVLKTMPLKSFINPL